MMFSKLTFMAVAGAALLSVTAASAQIPGYVPGDGPPPPGYGAAPPPGYRPPPPQPRRSPPPVQSDSYDYRGRDNYDYRGRDSGWERRPRYGYDDPAPRPRGRFGDYCATSRGACQTRPQPVGTSCRCDIDGLTKRGIIQ